MRPTGRIRPAILEAFIARYKDTFFAELARARVNELKKRQIAVAVLPKAAPRSLAKPVTAPLTSAVRWG
jgi:hypothetical protein